MLEKGFYNMDCMEGMRQFPDGFFDLAVVDPPYGINADMFNCGSASSLIACRRAGLDYWGFEIDPDYYAKARERLDAEENQLSIFDLQEV